MYQRIIDVHYEVAIKHFMVVKVEQTTPVRARC